MKKDNQFSNGILDVTLGISALAWVIINLWFWITVSSSFLLGLFGFLVTGFIMPLGIFGLLIRRHENRG